MVHYRVMNSCLALSQDRQPKELGLFSLVKRVFSESLVWLWFIMRQWLTVVGALCLISAIACAAEEVKEQDCERNLNAPSDTPLPRGIILGPRMVKKSDMVAGKDGDNFDDQLELTIKVGVMNITIWHGKQINAIQVAYRDADGTVSVSERHGGDGGQETSYSLSTDEVVVGIEGYTTDVVVDRISFVIENTVTGERKTFGPFGNTGLIPYYLNGLILCFYGKSSSVLNGIGAYYMDIPSKSPVYGGKDGAPWQDPVMWNFDPIVGISEINIWSGLSVDSIQVNYYVLWGYLYEGEKHGGDGGSLSTIRLDRDEVVVRVHMSVGLYINQLRIVTRKQSGYTREYGPFGEAGDRDRDVTIYGRVIGFYGGEGDVLDALGAYFIRC